MPFGLDAVKPARGPTSRGPVRVVTSGAVALLEWTSEKASAVVAPRGDGSTLIGCIERHPSQVPWQVVSSPWPTSGWDSSVRRPKRSWLLMTGCRIRCDDSVQRAPRPWGPARLSVPASDRTGDVPRVVADGRGRHNVVRLGPYVPPLRTWVLEAKRPGRPWRDMALMLGRCLADQLDHAEAVDDRSRCVVVPVPTSRWRAWGRGVDHSRVMACGVTDRWGGRPSRVLVRMAGAPQTGQRRSVRRGLSRASIRVSRRGVARVRGREVVLGGRRSDDGHDGFGGGACVASGGGTSCGGGGGGGVGRACWWWRGVGI